MFTANFESDRKNTPNYLLRLSLIWGQSCLDEVWGENCLDEITENNALISIGTENQTVLQLAV